MVRSYLVILLCTCLSVVATDLPPINPIASDKKLNVLNEFLAMPFRDLVLLPYSKKSKMTFLMALRQRPEVAAIDWTVKDPEELARQLWTLQSEESDASYNRALYTVTETLMRVNHVHPDTMKQVQALISEWRKLKTTRRFHKNNPNKTIVENQTEEIRQRRAYYARRRSAYRRLGKGLPLLSYIDLAKIDNPTPQRVHEEALKYQSMYPSSLSFMRNLRNLFVALKYTDGQIVKLLQQDRSFDCPQWDATQRIIGNSGRKGCISSHDNGLQAQDIEHVQQETFASNQDWPLLNVDALDHSLWEPFDLSDTSTSTSDLSQLQFDNEEDDLLPSLGQSVNHYSADIETLPDWDSLGLQ